MKRWLTVLLGGAAAVAATGCCEALHLGWASSVGPRSWRELRPLDRALAATASTDAQGYFDDDTCERACRVADEITLEGCYPVAVAASVAGSRTVGCKYPGYPFTDRTSVPAAELQPVELRPFNELPQDFCQRACQRPDVGVPECTLVPVAGPAPRPDQPFVVCELYRGSHCSGPSLSRGASCEQPGL